MVNVKIKKFVNINAAAMPGPFKFSIERETKPKADNKNIMAEITQIQAVSLNFPRPKSKFPYGSKNIEMKYEKIIIENIGTASKNLSP